MKSVEEGLLGRIHPDEALDLLVALINAPSAAPDLPEEDCAQVVARKLRADGVAVTVAEVERHRPNVLAQLGEGRGRSLLLSAHLDTVGAGERSAWSSDPFAARVANGRVFGRGASDDKGGVAAITLAFLALERAGALPGGRLHLSAVMGEETGNVGTRHFLSGAPPLDAALVAEWTGAADVAVGYRGALWVEVRTTGRAAHGARPQEGVNAIDLMTERVLPALKTLPWSCEPAPLFSIPCPTVNVGRIEGGERVNVVADACAALVDFRLVPGLGCEGVSSLLRKTLEDLQRSWEGATASFRVLLRNEPFLLGSSEPVLEVLTGSIRDVTGRHPRWVGKAGFSDANVLMGEAGIPTVTFGPGNSSGHGPDEFVELDEVVTAAKVIALTALRFTRRES
ncbi:MAG: M20 family metallopeptidase [Candidatus Tectomicrobia bacterium]|nr:M20 family metallopeptidase [Candidatus Tectomicrobia bacterium]